VSDRVQTADEAKQSIAGSNGVIGELHKESSTEELEERLFEELLQKYRAALLTSEELEAAPIKPRLKLVGEWFWEGDLGFIYGERGIGKTWFVEGLAVQLSIGKDFDTWAIPSPAPVLYVDGEMPQDSTRDRLKGLAQKNKNLIVLHHERIFDSSGLSMNFAEPFNTENPDRHLYREKS
jgi:RecA-family ATPase